MRIVVALALGIVGLGAAVACSDREESAPAPGDAGDAASDVGIDAAIEPITCTATPCIVDVAAGSSHVCALTRDKTVLCWGANALGQCGPNGAPDGGARLHPTWVEGLQGITKIAIGVDHGCALTEEGKVLCWGSNRFGQVGRPTDGGNFESSPTPVEVSGFPSRPVEIAAGVFSTCARLESGQVACWGSNNTGQLGTGTVTGTTITPDYAISPVLAAVSDSSQIGTTARVVCSLGKDGGVSCWGNALQLGNAGPTDAGFAHPDPVSLLGLAGPVAELGKGHGYAELVRLVDGRVQVFGDNEDHVAGFADAGRMIPTATLIPGLVAKQVSISGHHACARRSDDTVVCWGNTQLGAVGLDPDAAPHYQDTPIAIPNLTDVVRVTVGWNDFACALIRGGSVRCWGDDSRGQLGRGTAGGYDHVAAPVAF